jgi:hypothetical protein
MLITTLIKPLVYEDDANQADPYAAPKETAMEELARLSHKRLSMSEDVPQLEKRALKIADAIADEIGVSKWPGIFTMGLNGQSEAGYTKVGNPRYILTAVLNNPKYHNAVRLMLQATRSRDLLTRIEARLNKVRAEARKIAREEQ